MDYGLEGGAPPPAQRFRGRPGSKSRSRAFRTSGRSFDQCICLPRPPGRASTTTPNRWRTERVANPSDLPVRVAVCLLHAGGVGQADVARLVKSMMPPRNNKEMCPGVEFIFPFKNGVVDLRTREFRPACAKRSGHAYPVSGHVNLLFAIVSEMENQTLSLPDPIARLPANLKSIWNPLTNIALTLTDMPESIIEHIGKQFTHTGGYKDKLRLGMATHNVGASTRLGAELHYYTERLQSAMREPYSNAPRAYGKIPIREDLHHLQKVKRDAPRYVATEVCRSMRRLVDRPLKDRLDRPIDRGR
eukprot:SAG22_NODE_1897_length_3356_cov_3.577832_2_plen_303_part_00